jgi:NAD(P)H-dependent flavin oxidoreductase YrpB (nitropropane dioxygenase family)
MLAPSLFPLTLYACEYLSAHTSLPIIACGGIIDRKQAQSALGTGAVAVQFGSVLLRDPLAFKE